MKRCGTVRSFFADAAELIRGCKLGAARRALVLTAGANGRCAASTVLKGAYSNFVLKRRDFVKNLQRWRGCPCADTRRPRGAMTPLRNNVCDGPLSHPVLPVFLSCRACALPGSDTRTRERLFLAPRSHDVAFGTGLKLARIFITLGESRDLDG